MGILDRLLEKKDVNAYIALRIKELGAERAREMGAQPPGNRELVRQRFEGRVAELQRLRRLVAEGQLKEQSKKSYRHRGQAKRCGG